MYGEERPGPVAVGDATRRRCQLAAAATSSVLVAQTTTIATN